MPEGAIERRLERIEERQQQIIVAIERLTLKAEVNAGTVSAVIAEVGGAPDVATRQGRLTMRDRIHDLENDTAAATAAKAALEAATAARIGQWTVREKTLVGLCAIGTFAMSLLRVAGIGV